MLKQLIEIECEGETLDDSVNLGLNQLQCTRAEVDVSILQVPSAGLFGRFFVKPARVKVKVTDRAVVARLVCEKILQLSKLDGTVEVHQDSHCIDLIVHSEFSSLIIGRHGQTLQALQSLVSTITDRLSPGAQAIVLDIDAYRQRRRTSLSRLARRLASQVRRSGKQAATPLLPFEERKIFHLALQDEHDVEGRSVGQGTERKIIIFRRSSDFKQ